MKTYHADAFTILPTLEADSFDAVITDPPYGSGTLADQRKSSVKSNAKYIFASGAAKFPEMEDGYRDRLAHYLWTCDWMRLCKPLIKEGGYLMAFTDWRTLPHTALAVQNAGYIWQGINIWHKPSGRPNLGRFSRIDEFVLIATKGTPRGGQYNSEIRTTFSQLWEGRLSPKERNHATSKPVDLMKHLMQVIPDGGNILDPFMGGGSTLVAARETGRHATGIEITEENFRNAEERINQNGQNK